MRKGVNLAIIVGHLGADPETRYSPSGAAVTKLSVATSEQWRDKQSGEKREATQWHRITMFGSLAEIACEYLRKGGQVYIEGRIQTSKYEKEGQTHYSTEIIAREMQMLGAASGKDDNRPPSRSAQSGQAYQDSKDGTKESEPEFDDDLPF